MLTKVKTTSKKAFSIFLAFVMCFTAFAICMPVIADAIATGSYVKGRYYYYPQGTQFISSIRYGQAGKSADANSEATQGGYARLDTDFNSGVSGKDYIYLGYQTSTNINDAMATYFRNGHGTGGADTYDFMVNGKVINFTITALNTSGKQDLNADAGGDYIYLYATKDPQAGLPVTAITASSTDNSDPQTPAGYYAVERNNNSSASDCNAGAGGDYVYIYFNNTSAYTDVTNQMLRMLEAIETANKLGNQNCYTADTWRTFSDALTAANRIANLYNNPYNAGTADASQITAAASALENAMLKLQTVIRIDATTNGGVTTDTQCTVLSGDNATVSFPASKYTATKEGHTFLGWSTDKNATTGNKTTLKVPVGGTVYAIFSINQFTVKFYNSVTKETVKTETVDYKANATAPDVVQIIRNNADTHYKFKHWDKAFTNITESITVNAVYEAENHSFVLTSETPATCNKTGSKLYTCSACGYTKTETAPVVPGNHTNTTEYPAKASTCNVAGYTAYIYCNDCNTIISGKEPLPLAEHTWGDWSAPTATCTEDGTSTRKCSVCDATETKPVSATGHSWGNWETTKEATCTANGREQRQCSICRETETKIINAKGHSYEAVVTDPTCTEIGFTTHTCSVCGDSYIDSYVDALDHNWQNVGAPTVEATCTTSGKQNQKCSRCPETRIATVEALGHDWQNETIAKYPTCTEDGLMSATCNRCTESQTDIVIPAPGHDWSEGVVTVQPTCTTPGNRHVICNTCKEEKDILINALGHNWDEGTVRRQPTCTTEGLIYFECGRCDVSKTDRLPVLDHDYNGVVTFPTCTEGGYTTYTCNDCGKVMIDDRTDALGHSDIVTIVPPTCAQQGYTATRCLICNRVIRTDYVPATGHNYEKIIVSPTCTEKGYTADQCTICYEEKNKVSIDALGHEYSDSTVNPTCTQKGYVLHDCIRCDHTYTDNYVAALGHNHLEVDRVAPSKTHNGYILFVCDVCANEKKEILYYDGKALICETLYDSEGNPVAEATVTIYSINKDKSYTVKTDLNGYFTEVLEEGDYQIVITRIGYKDTIGYIHVSNNNAIVDIPVIPAIDECDCYCHKTDFISAIRRIIAKIMAIFGMKHECCEYSEV